MTTLLTSLASIWFAYLIVRAVAIAIALRKMAKRNKAKQELGEKIQRKLDRAIELNLAIIDEGMKGNQEAADSLIEVSKQESEEIEAMMKEYEAI